MTMKINEVSKLTGLSIKTLHHFDNIGLLCPKRNSSGYRDYTEDDITKLQTILFFRELDFPLKEITNILQDKNFDLREALKDQIKLLEIKQKRINSIIELAKNNLGETKMKKEFKPFNNYEFEQYEKEVKEKWGNTEAYKESQIKLRNQSKENIQKDGDLMMDIFRKFGLVKDNKIDKEALNLVKELQDFITNHYYKCDNKILVGLGEMYIADERFKNNIDKKGGTGTAEFVNSCIKTYVNQ
jgi:DNA-binding transcriptional MerR regulator